MNEPDAPQPPPDPQPIPPERPAETQPFIATLQSVWERIKHHKVVQWTLAYLAIAYTLLHGAEMLTGSLGWPHGWVRLFTLLLILGIPIVVTLAWYHGARGQQRASGTEIMIIALLVAIGGAFMWQESSDHEEAIESHTATSQVSAADLPLVPTELVAPDDKSIAVLPFVDMSAKKDQEYMSDGIAEELLNLLAQIPDLKVMARTSSFAFKGQNIDIPDIAKKLNVAHVLEGSVRTDGDKMRVTTQLIRGSDGYHQWSETYDRTLKDVFAVQEEIANAVVAQLKIALLGPPAVVRTTNPEAYAAYLQALQLDRKGEFLLEESSALYKRAVELDPDYAPAWFGLGANLAIQADYGERPLGQGMEEARGMFKKAISIDPKYGLPHAGLGWIAMNYDLDLAAAARHFERALKLSPADLYTLSVAGALSDVLGRVETGVQLGEYLVSRDPMDPLAHFGLGTAYQNAGRYDDAIGSFRAALRLSPKIMGAHGAIGDTYFLKGDYKAALRAFESEPMEGLRLAGLASTHYVLGNRSASDAALAKLTAEYENWAAIIAVIFSERGDKDRAFEWLDRAATARDSGLALLSTVWLKDLHDDPRWLVYLRRIGRAPEQLAAISFELKVPTH